MAPAGVVIKAATGVPVTTTVHGLDVTYGARMYQALIPRALRHLDLAIADSVATERSLHERTGALPRSEVIPLGVNSLPRPDDASSRRFEESIGVAGAPVLLTVGRLVPRKGVAWFVQQVLPDLPTDVVYMVIGQGAERDAILAAASAAGVSSRVRLLGHVDDGVLAAAYARADVFVMPNIDIPGDMEGFGLVALEAAAAGVPVVAARLEGITEAVRHGRNGFLLPSRDADAFVGCLKRLLALPAGQRRTIGERMARYALDTFGWDKTATRYLEVMEAEVNCQRQHEARCADAAA
jgi:glycosyltransferase involved in cell wall biosynthesis